MHFIRWMVVLLAGIGLADCLYVYMKRLARQPLVSLFTNHDCNAVVISRFGTFRGIPTEVYGIIYYVLVVVLTVVFSAQTGVIMFTLSLVAMIVSAFLAVVQVGSLRNYCEYCIIAAGINVLMFLLVASGRLGMWPLIMP